MDYMPIPYFAMIMSLFVAPALTFGFIAVIKKIKSGTEQLKLKKEILELEIKKEETLIRKFVEENKKYDRLISETERS